MINTEQQLDVTLFSFGFKYGTPSDINHIVDVRFLPNPYWVEGMRHKTGLEPEVAEYVITSDAGKDFTKHFVPFLHCLCRNNTLAKKPSIRIAIGCTGGRHRSVAMTAELARALQKEDIKLTVFHRDIEKDALASDENQGKK